MAGGVDQVGVLVEDLRERLTQRLVPRVPQILPASSEIAEVERIDRAEHGQRNYQRRMDIA